MPIPDLISDSVRLSGHRADTWRVRLYLDGESLGIWDKKTGGEIDSEDSNYPPGGLGPPIAIGGRKTTGNITLSRMFVAALFDSVLAKLLDRVGKGRIVVAQLPIDDDGKEFGKGFNFSGKLKRVNTVDVDNESSTAAMIEIEVSISGYPMAG